eukprot:1956147-Prymnesium_polylepis.1
MCALRGAPQQPRASAFAPHAGTQRHNATGCSPRRHGHRPGALSTARAVVAAPPLAPSARLPDPREHRTNRYSHCSPLRESGARGSPRMPTRGHRTRGGHDGTPLSAFARAHGRTCALS